MTQAYPLQWPAGWPRTPAHDRVDAQGRFLRGGAYGNKPWTFAAARDALYEEIERLGAPNWDVVLSSNFLLNHRGEPSTSRGRPEDQGVAVYFRLGNRQLVMACDRFKRAEENMRSITLAIQAMRQLERHGGGVMMEKAFAGFAALPPPRSCWDVLGVAPGASRSEIDAAYRRLARELHPDTGGPPGAMAELNQARDTALKGGA